MPSSRGSFWRRDRTIISCVSCIGRQVLYHLGSPLTVYWSMFMYIYSEMYSIHHNRDGWDRVDRSVKSFPWELWLKTNFLLKNKEFNALLTLVVFLWETRKLMKYKFTVASWWDPLELVSCTWYYLWLFALGCKESQRKHFGFRRWSGLCEVHWCFHLEAHSG